MYAKAIRQYEVVNLTGGLYRALITELLGAVTGDNSMS